MTAAVRKLQREKQILRNELEKTLPSTRKDEIINRILEIEMEILRLLWESASYAYS